jgi:hypothetical protein
LSGAAVELPFYTVSAVNDVIQPLNTVTTAATLIDPGLAILSAPISVAADATTILHSFMAVGRGEMTKDVAALKIGTTLVSRVFGFALGEAADVSPSTAATVINRTASGLDLGFDKVKDIPEMMGDGSN